MKKLWPEDWFPPYKVAWRLLWAIPVYIAMGLLLLVVAISNGPTSWELKDLWEYLN
jgi:hypothetical protein